MKKHIISLSGGKDSTAMLIRMLELNYPVDEIIFADTRYEFPEMYEYLEKVQEYLYKHFKDAPPIRTITTPEPLEKWIFGQISRGKRKGQIRGWPLTVHKCNWSRESKQKILEKEIGNNIRYIGIALDEKHRMVKDHEERGYKYPLIEWGWTEQDALEYLKGKDLHNVLYDKFDRLGCFWCPKQSIQSLRIIYNEYPDKWKWMMEWDKKISRIKTDNSFKPNWTLPELDQRFKKEAEGEQ